VSYKIKNRKFQARDKWWRVENTHEPIIDIDTWNLVQERYLHRGKPARKSPPSVFQRIVLCADCGKQMWLTPYQRKPNGEISERRYFQCSTYRQYSKLKCTIHSTNYMAVQAIVLNDIREYARFALENPDELLKRLTEAENKQKQSAHKQTQKDYDTGVKRLSELENLLRRLFEENVAGRMNNENYEVLFSRYQAEQQDLKPRVEELTKKLTTFTESRSNSRKWIALIAKYADLQELDMPIVNELCEKILIHQYEKINGKRVQKIEIFYRFAGKLPTVNGKAEHEIHGTRGRCRNNATNSA
jgi:chromosome segregation ATPase